MAPRDSYTPGTPCWVDLGVPDLDATVAFYEALFGWKVPEPGDGSGYRVALVRGHPVAGFGASEPGADTWWTTYVSVADCDESATKVSAAGGTVEVEPNDLPGAGRIAVCADVVGAPFTL